MRTNDNYGKVTAESLAKSQAYWAAVKVTLDARKTAKAA